MERSFGQSCPVKSKAELSSFPTIVSIALCHLHQQPRLMSASLCCPSEICRWAYNHSALDGKIPSPLSPAIPGQNISTFWGRLTKSLSKEMERVKKNDAAGSCAFRLLHRELIVSMNSTKRHELSAFPCALKLFHRLPIYFRVYVLQLMLCLRCGCCYVWYISEFTV